ncbi:SWIM zinc finger family protein [Solwaraspora sp. WMMA2056]|uniref:SWIM zinc finger family protein n=1 Tax=Solwaraspora sp. WMMA2056 TaxID=3015161 RepID=UPI00259B0454|nr:SWIM zinc finger family protein [Solwaraspora sp. WMMA2056]WJK43551.1 SWIM zinc finger family protein [Solwaraspora sp. WMMA2056]
MSRFDDYGRPRRVDGGLRARSTRGAIGQSWWSRRFVDVLESFALGTRLTRGRSYARAGQVLALTVAPGAVTAQVQGSRPRPYQVRIGLTPFGAPVWRRIEQTLAGQALYSARLLAGDLPPELEEVFAAAGAPLFPAGIDELTMRCSCPDAAVPCKHLAATCYLLAEEFDTDPFQILHWRGRDRATLLAQLRRARAGGDVTAPAPEGDPAVADPAVAGPAAAGSPVGAAAALADLTPPVADVDFWRAPVPLPAREPVLPAGADLLLRQLGAPAPTIGGPGLVELLGRAYRRFAGPSADAGLSADAGPAPDGAVTSGGRAARAPRRR